MSSFVRSPELHQRTDTVRVGVRRIHKAVCAWSRWHLANGTKTCPSLLVFKNNNIARGSQGFVHQSSRNVTHVYSNHMCLTSFFQNYHILLRSGVIAESLWAGSENMPNLSLLAQPVV